MWWLKDDGALALPAGSGDVTEDITPANITDTVYLSDFSSREITGEGQELDVLAPGSWVRGPFAGDPGYSHLPWWSNGVGDLHSSNPSNFYYVGGTSMAAPHVSAVSALLLQKDPTLVQAQVEQILRDSAIPMPDTASVEIWDNTIPATITWDTYCELSEMACDPVGFGLMQADEALGLLP
jgi:subtilisin family serine protease